MRGPVLLTFPCRVTHTHTPKVREEKGEERTGGIPEEKEGGGIGRDYI